MVAFQIIIVKGGINRFSEIMTKLNGRNNGF